MGNQDEQQVEDMLVFGGGVVGPQQSDLLQALVDELAAYHKDAELYMPCQLDLLLVHESFDFSTGLESLYPINTIRNYARLQARTPMMAQFDVDLVIGKPLFTFMSAPRKASLLEAKLANSTAVVVPALVHVHPNGSGTAAVQQPPYDMAASQELVDGLAATATKDELRPYFEKGLLQRFNPEQNTHRATMLEYWFGSRKYYRVRYEGRYEPWMVMHRRKPPFFDARFRGYGQDKPAFMAYLVRGLKYRLVVHPTAYAIHRDHPPSVAKYKFLHGFHKHRHNTTLLNDRSVFGHNLRLSKALRQQVEAGSYVPLLDPATAACSRELQWWQ